MPWLHCGKERYQARSQGGAKWKYDYVPQSASHRHRLLLAMDCTVTNFHACNWDLQ